MRIMISIGGFTTMTTFWFYGFSATETHVSSSEMRTTKEDTSEQRKIIAKTSNETTEYIINQVCWHNNSIISQWLSMECIWFVSSSHAHRSLCSRTNLIGWNDWMKYWDAVRRGRKPMTHESNERTSRKCILSTFFWTDRFQLGIP